MTKIYNKNNLTQDDDKLFDRQDLDENRKGRSIFVMFELYYTDRSQFGKLTPREDLFVAFLDVMSSGRKFTYTEKVTDDIFSGKVGNRPVLIKLVKANKIEDYKGIVDELNKTAIKLRQEGQQIERTYLLQTKSNGMTEMDLASRPNLS